MNVATIMQKIENGENQFWQHLLLRFKLCDFESFTEVGFLRLNSFLLQMALHSIIAIGGNKSVKAEHFIFCFWHNNCLFDFGMHYLVIGKRHYRLLEKYLSLKNTVTKS